MDPIRLNALIDRLLETTPQEDPDGAWFGELVPSPHLSLDLESYQLLSTRTQTKCYPKAFTFAAQLISSGIQPSLITRLMAVVKRNRARGQARVVRSKLRRAEWTRVVELSQELGVRPARVLEAALFLYLRTDEA